MKKARNIILVFVCVVLAGYVLVANYAYIFSRRVIGTITAVERVNLPMTVLAVGGQEASSQIFSFAVGIKDAKTNEIVTASSEDRQWAVAKPGQCAEALYFPYPPWNLEKANTYYNARLEKLMDCSTPMTK